MGLGHVLSTSNLYLPDYSRVMEYSARFLQSDEETGAVLNLLEERLSDYHDSKYCVLFNSGFWALVSAIKAKALPGKQYVLMPSFTYRRLADVVYWSGYTPYFVDIDPATLALSPLAVADCLNNDVALILGVHPIVNCCDIDALLSISNTNGVPIVIDAVESVHETFAGKRVGSFGFGEVFSLHASKLINGMEGGYVCTNDEALMTELRKHKLYEMHDGHAAFALACLDEIGINVSHNRDIYYAYRENIQSINGIRLLKFEEKEQTSYKNIVVEVTGDYGISRDKLVDILNHENVLARAYYSPPLSKKKYSFDTVASVLDNEEYACSRYLNLPCGSMVTVDDVKRVCELLVYVQNALKHEYL